MLKIDGNKLGLTRGDSAYIRADIRQSDGEPYELKTGDKLKMTFRKELGGPVLMAVESTQPTIHILPSDSRNLVVGPGFFDLQLQSGVEIYTLVGPEHPALPNLTVYPEVTKED